MKKHIAFILAALGIFFASPALATHGGACPHQSGDGSIQCAGTNVYAAGTCRALPEPTCVAPRTQLDCSIWGCICPGATPNYCSSFNTCVATIACTGGQTFDACANGGAGGCVGDINVILNPAAAQSGNISITGNATASGDVYMANGKAIRVDANGATSLYMSNWHATGNAFDLIVGDPTVGAGLKLDGMGNSLNLNRSSTSFMNRVIWSTGGLNDWQVGQIYGGPTFAIKRITNPAVNQDVGITPLYIDGTGDGLIGLGNIQNPSSVLDILGSFTVRGQAGVAVSPAGQGRLFFDAATSKFRISENGGAYVNLINTSGATITGTPAAGQAAFWTGASTLSGDPSFVWDNASKRLGIGVASPNNRIQVNGLINFNNATSSTYLGLNAGNASTGIDNVFVGFLAGMSNTSGSNNVALGSNALVYNTTGAYNTATGWSSLLYNTTGGFNTAYGFATLYTNTIGDANTALGHNALRQNSNGGANTAVGYNALYGNTSGGFNTAMGRMAMFSNTTGTNNTAIGSEAFMNNTGGAGNASLGYGANRYNTTGNYNVAVGYNAGYVNATNANTTGSNNVFIGYLAGPGTATQLTNATALGSNALVSQSNSLVLGGTGANSVNVGIGTATPTATLDVVGTAKMTGFQLGGGTTVGSTLAANASGVGTWSSNLLNNGLDILIGTSAPLFGNYDGGGRTLSVIGGNTAGALGNLELGSISSDTDSKVFGTVNFMHGGTTDVEKRLAQVRAMTDGASAGSRGGRFQVFVQNSGSDFMRLAIDTRQDGVTELYGFKLAAAAGAGKVLTSDAAGVATWQTPGSGMGGSGTVNYVPKFTAATTLGNSLLFDNGTTVAIGTAAPSTAKFQVRDGAVLFDGALGSTPASGTGTRLMWIPAKAAFRAGQTQTTEWDDINVGTNSVALNIGTLATGNASMAVNFYTDATGSYSFAAGSGTVASGYASTAFGNSNTASGSRATVMGFNSTSTGDHTLASGYYASAGPGQSAVALGHLTTASGAYSFTNGLYTRATATNSMSMGHGADAVNYLANAITDSMMIGFNSNIPTLFVGPSAGLNTTGNVGVGTSTPGTKLQVDHNGAATFGVALKINQYQVGNSDGPKLEFYKTMTSSMNWTVGMADGVNVSDFAVSSGAGTGSFGTKRMVINTAGRMELGNGSADYAPGGGNWNYSLLLTALDTSSIGFHDASASVSSIRYNNGGFTIGGDDGWGVRSVTTGGNLNIGGVVPCIQGTCPPNSAIRMTPNLHLNSGAGSAVIANWDNGTTGATQTFRIGNGAGADVFYVYADGQAFTTNWWRSLGNTGWYNQTYGGGWHMQDSTWIRSYGGKPVYMANGYDSGAPSGVQCGGGLGGGYNFHVCGSAKVDSTLVMGWDQTIQGTNRLHISSGQDIYLLPTGGSVVVSDAWGGAADLYVAGDWVKVAGAGGERGYFGSDGCCDIQIGSEVGVNELHVWGPAVSWMRVRAEGYDIGSSIRWKKDIVELPDALGSVRKMRGVNFRWKDVPEADKSQDLQVGFIAEEMMKIVPEVVKLDDKAPGFATAIDYGKLTPVLAQAIKELDAQTVKIGEDGKVVIAADLAADANLWGDGSGWIFCPEKGECSCPQGTYMTKLRDQGAEMYCNAL